jgi:hypothetical protein
VQRPNRLFDTDAHKCARALRALAACAPVKSDVNPQVCPSWSQL